jgi:hypothetical protein
MLLKTTFFLGKYFSTKASSIKSLKLDMFYIILNEIITPKCEKCRIIKQKS